MLYEGINNNIYFNAFSLEIYANKNAVINVLRVREVYLTQFLI